MQKTKPTKTIRFVMVLLVVVTMIGCGKRENKYVGRYVEELTPDAPPMVRWLTTLELGPNGGYKFQPSRDSVMIGEWRVVKSEGEEYIEFTPTLGISLRKTKKRGYCFVCPTGFGEEILVKEAED